MAGGQAARAPPEPVMPTAAAGAAACAAMSCLPCKQLLAHATHVPVAHPPSTVALSVCTSKVQRSSTSLL